MSSQPSAAQRLAFGQVADLYDRARPSYPRAAVDAVIEFGALAPPMRIVEIGAGTGKATVLFAVRGLGVVGLEPSAEMAGVARAKCADYPEVEIVEAEFEHWPAPELFAALVSVNAWHWIAPEQRYEKAAQALAPGATLASIWTFPDWERCPLRAALSAAYRRAAPDLSPEFPMHPDSEPTRLAGDWRGEIESTSAFCDPVTRSYPWSESYNASGYAALLATHQDHILLQPGRRAELMAAIAATIDQAGGTLAMPFVTYVCLARRCPDPAQAVSRS